MVEGVRVKLTYELKVHPDVKHFWGMVADWRGQMVHSMFPCCYYEGMIADWNLVRGRALNRETLSF